MSDVGSQAFKQAGADRQSGLIGEFYHLLRHNKKFWIIPLLLVLLGMSVLILLGGTAAAPFIYTLF
jgi:hypothetical protein